MENYSTLTSKGQITIPKDIRLLMGLGVGDILSFKIDDEKNIILARNKETTSLAGFLLNDANCSSAPLQEEDIQNAILQGIMRKKCELE